MSYPNSPFAPMNAPSGWVCPKCTKVYAPFVTECWSCNQKTNPNMTYAATSADSGPFPPGTK